MVRRVYLDTSAFLRGVLADAPEHAAVEVLLNDPAWQFISSDLLWLEADRAGIRLMAGHPSWAGLRADVERGLRRVDRVALDQTVLAAARAIPEVVKSLDAIHIATAELLGDSIDRVLTYDATMTRVLRAHGLVVATAKDLAAPQR